MRELSLRAVFHSGPLPCRRILLARMKTLMPFQILWNRQLSPGVLRIHGTTNLINPRKRMAWTSTIIRLARRRPAVLKSCWQAPLKPSQVGET